jgi:hypothetical protein
MQSYQIVMLAAVYVHFVTSQYISTLLLVVLVVAVHADVAAMTISTIYRPKIHSYQRTISI